MGYQRTGESIRLGVLLTRRLLGVSAGQRQLHNVLVGSTPLRPSPANAQDRSRTTPARPRAVDRLTKGLIAMMAAVDLTRATSEVRSRGDWLASCQRTLPPACASEPPASCYGATGFNGRPRLLAPRITTSLTGRALLRACHSLHATQPRQGHRPRSALGPLRPIMGYLPRRAIEAWCPSLRCVGLSGRQYQCRRGGSGLDNGYQRVGAHNFPSPTILRLTP